MLFRVMGQGWIHRACGGGGGGGGGVNTPPTGVQTQVGGCWAGGGGGGGVEIFTKMCKKNKKFCLKMRENRDSRKNLSPVASNFHRTV